MTYRESKRAWERSYVYALISVHGTHVTTLAHVARLNRTHMYRLMQRAGVSVRPVHRGQWERSLPR